MKKRIPFLLLIFLIFSSCNVTKNWNSNQTKNYWSASFDNFSNKETIKFPSDKNSIVYLSSQVNIEDGDLHLKLNNNDLSNTNKVNHYRLNLNNNTELKIISNEAKGSFILKYPTYTIKNIQINYNQNIELLALCFLLINSDDYSNFTDDQSFEIDGENVKIKDLYALNLKIINEFKPFLKSKNLQVIKSYFDKNWYLHYSNFIMSLDTFPNAKITKNNDFSHLFTSKEDAEKFVNTFNDFSNEINFQGFLSKYNPYYKEMIDEVTKNIPKENFIIEMEHLYNKEVTNYKLYPSLILSFSQGFAVGSEDTIGNVFAAFRKPKEINNLSSLNLGFDNINSLRTICIHEFGHSFINPAIDKVDSQILQKTAYLFEPIRDNMSPTYNDWKICLYEHFVRANEVMVTRLVGDNSKADEILKDNVDKKFIYLPQIVEKLEFWYNNEYLTKTYEQKVSEIISELK